MNRTLFSCACTSLEHMVVLEEDVDNLYLAIHLSPLPFTQRVKNALRYVLGRRCKYGDFEEIILSPDTAIELGDKLTEWAQGPCHVFECNDVH